jgi:flagellar export protein FliJ
MKTKFSQLVQVKKRRVDEIENELLDIQNQKRRVLIQIEDLLKEIFKIKTPKNGSFSQINIAHMYLKNFSNQKSRYEEEIVKLNQQILGIKELYKEANIEFEKVKYLENLEIQKQLHALKIQENKDMDEIANMLFAKKSRDVVYD